MHRVLSKILFPATLSLLITSVATASMTPGKQWFAPGQPINIDVKPGGEATLVLTDFAGKVISPQGSADVAADKTVNLRDLFIETGSPGAYVLFLVKKGAAKDLAAAPADFIGTPLVINVRDDKRPNAPPGVMVTRVMPLQYAVMQTPAGTMTMVFYYDVAPNTAENFLRLSAEGFYDGLSFHRIVPGFVIQGGDPRGDGTGGPGYTIPAEFNRRPHTEGVLSMARNGSPNEGFPPAPQFANSASSQFFVCLDYNGTRQLDNKYTTFGEVVEGLDVVKKIGAAPVADPANGRPAERQGIDKVEVKNVTAAENPYAKLFKPVSALGAVK
jgi:peptidyl-prolyl cis-trans isomerase B (cyclophilin B)